MSKQPISDEVREMLGKLDLMDPADAQEAVRLLSKRFAPAAGTIKQDPALIQRRKEELAPHYDQQIENIRTFFKDENYAVAGTLFEYLLEKKGPKMRKNKYVPDYGHEIDQILPLMTYMQAGNLDAHEESIVKAHGSIENWFCAKISHDIFENFGIFPDKIISELLEGVPKYTGEELTDDQNVIIERTAISMERLTHYRKYKPEEFKEITGQIPDFSNPRSDGIVDLRKDWNDFFWDKMNCFEDGDGVGRNHMQVFAKWDDPDKEPLIIVTQYGFSQETIPTEKAIFGPEWALYSQGVCKDFFCGMTKADDRVNGEATRIAGKFSLDSTRQYFNWSDLLFNGLGTRQILIGTAHPKTPLMDEVNSVFAMQDLLNFLGNIYIAAHTDNSSSGEKAINPAHIPRLKTVEGESPFFLSRFFQNGYDANLFYKNVPRQSHPAAVFMRELRDAPGLAPEHKKLYQELKAALMVHGGETMRGLLSRPDLESPDPNEELTVGPLKPTKD